MTQIEHDRIVAELVARYEAELRRVRRLTLAEFAAVMGRPVKSVQVALSRDKRLADALDAQVQVGRITVNEHAAREYAATRSRGKRA